MSEYSWRKEDESSKTNVPVESFPKRVALTATGVITNRQTVGKTTLLLCNPHPDTWNSWMLPYGSLAIDVEAVDQTMSFGKLAEYMEKLREENIENYERKALAQVCQLVGLQQERFDYEPNLSNFSLKFSKSANVWTAYCFAYHIYREGQSAKPNVQATWLTLNDEKVTSLVKDGMLDGLAVADNVLSLLKDPEMLNLIR